MDFEIWLNNILEKHPVRSEFILNSFSKRCVYCSYLLEHSNYAECTKLDRNIIIGKKIVLKRKERVVDTYGVMDFGLPWDTVIPFTHEEEIKSEMFVGVSLCELKKMGILDICPACGATLDGKAKTICPRCELNLNDL
ncbi:MAG: hypothetical protein ACTSU2_08360 [Promethearchaeota archaeon]